MKEHPGKSIYDGLVKTAALMDEAGVSTNGRVTAMARENFLRLMDYMTTNHALPFPKVEDFMSVSEYRAFGFIIKIVDHE